MTKRVDRLYNQFRPNNYELYLELNGEKAVFSGKVVISGQKAGRPSQRLTLHQKGLKIKSAKLTKHDKSGNQEVELDRINTHKSFDELRLHSPQMLYPGQYKIEIEFSGRITEPMHGIYPCNFKLNGQPKQLIATQFESHHAREAFPCIDEPEAKATFDLTLCTPTGETVIANTPIASQSRQSKVKSQRSRNGKKLSTNNSQLVTVFERTPKMSPYLLAFAYGELGYKESKTKNGVTVRVYATPDKVALTGFAVDVAVRSLEFFEDYFGIPYPLPKLDLIGLPDFSSGAMENWGLVTFREQVLYVDPKHSGIETKQFVAMVIAHELSHQWFGNLVTMRWWDDLWLNESFANLMEYRAVDELFPKWRIWEEFVYREVGGALARDALPTVQSVRTEVRHPDELSSLFDPSIVYAKGGSLLNMVRYLIGEDSFKKGLKTYFTQHQYSNTEAADLWRHLGKAAGVDIESMMKNWLQKPGFPVIETDYTPESKTLKLSQRRLAVGKSTDNSTVWTVPLAASLKLDKPLLNKKSEQFKLEPSGKYPLLLNHNGQSYFAARYLNKDHFESLIAAVKQNTLTPIDRLLLIQSYLLLERAGEVPTLDNVKLLRAYKAEREEAVWSILSGIIGNLRTLIGKDKELETKLNNFLIPIVSPLIKQVGWDAKKSDTSQTLKLRALALSLGAVCQIPEVIKEGLKRFESFEKPADLPADIRGVVYVIAVRFGQKSDFDKLVNLYKRLTNAEDKEDIAAELTATREEARIKQLLSMIATADVRLQDAPTWFAWLIRNKYGNELAWRWMIDNWNWVEEKYGEDKSFDYFPRYAASAFSYPEQLKSYRKFFGNKAELALQRPIKLGIEEVEGRVAWRAKNETAVKDWLSQLR